MLVSSSLNLSSGLAMPEKVISSAKRVNTYPFLIANLYSSSSIDKQTRFEITGDVGAPVGSQFFLMHNNAIAEAKLSLKLNGSFKNTFFFGHPVPELSVHRSSFVNMHLSILTTDSLSVNKKS